MRCPATVSAADLLLRLERLKRSLLLQDVGSIFELQGYIDAHLGKNFRIVSISRWGQHLQRSRGSDSRRRGLRRDLFDRDCCQGGVES